jgi:futalosine hydrolase
MKILIIVATENEIQPFLGSNIHKSYPIDILVTGVGMVSTAYFLTKKVKENTYSLLLNVGIAGSFHENVPLGTVVRVKEDCFCELGAQNDNEFLTLKELNLGEIHFQDNSETFNSLPSINNMQAVNGITVNRVHGKESSIKQIIKQFSPDTESMEGASVFYIAEQEQIPSLQIRAISNLVEKRNKANWNIPLAIKNLNDWLTQFTTELYKTNT